MKRLLELHDATGSGEKEYVDVDSITNIVPYRADVGGFWTTRYETVGSRVFSGGMDSGTFVKETPEKIVQMIRDKQFIVEA